MEEEIRKAIEKIRPMLQMDGGDLEYVGLEGNRVMVRLKGRCHGCPMSQMTLKNGVEKMLKEQVPEVESVDAVTD